MGAFLGPENGPTFGFPVSQFSGRRGAKLGPIFGSGKPPRGRFLNRPRTRKMILSRGPQRSSTPHTIINDALHSWNQIKHASRSQDIAVHALRSNKRESCRMTKLLDSSSLSSFMRLRKVHWRTCCTWPTTSKHDVYQEQNSAELYTPTEQRMHDSLRPATDTSGPKPPWVEAYIRAPRAQLAVK